MDSELLLVSLGQVWTMIRLACDVYARRRFRSVASERWGEGVG